MASGAASSSPRYRPSICARCFSAALRTLMSRIAAVTSVPSALSSGLSMISMGNSLPSLRRPVSSIPVPICCASASAAVRGPSAISRSAKPSGMMFFTFCPTQFVAAVAELLLRLHDSAARSRRPGSPPPWRPAPLPAARGTSPPTPWSPLLQPRVWSCRVGRSNLRQR